MAANATDPFNDAIAGYRHDGGSAVRVSYAGTQVLLTQLEQGRRPTCSSPPTCRTCRRLTASTSSAPTTRSAGPARSSSCRRHNPAGITGLRDLARSGVGVVIGVDAVPIGKYTRQVLGKADAEYGAGFSTAVLGNVVSMETDVKQVLHKVALGETDAGIVYLTDVTAAVTDQVHTLPVLNADEVEATYYAAVPLHAPHPKQARSLLGYLRSPAGQRNFQRYGYDPIRSGG